MDSKPSPYHVCPVLALDALAWLFPVFYQLPPILPLQRLHVPVLVPWGHPGLWEGRWLLWQEGSYLQGTVRRVSWRA